MSFLDIFLTTEQRDAKERAKEAQQKQEEEQREAAQAKIKEKVTQEAAKYNEKIRIFIGSCGLTENRIIYYHSPNIQAVPYEEISCPCVEPKPIHIQSDTLCCARTYAKNGYIMHGTIRISCARGDGERLRAEIEKCAGSKLGIIHKQEMAKILYAPRNNSTYLNHCWKCGANINSNLDKRCPSCKMFICSSCGACFC